LIACVGGLLAAAPPGARAQTPADMPPLPVMATTGRFVQIEAPGAVCAAVSDARGLLAIGHRGLSGVGVTLVALGADGQPAPAVPAVQAALPRPAAVAADANGALGVVFHPRLPLLYVWQDAPCPSPSAPAMASFDHLVVYDVSDGRLAVATNAARGAGYACGQAAGYLGTDPEGRRLFVPNLVDPGSGRSAIGYFPLATNGLPLSVEGVCEPVRADVADFQALPTGRGFMAPSERVVLVPVHHGLLVWDTANRVAEMGRVMVPGAPVLGFAGANPDGQVVYWAGAGASLLFLFAHVDGYPSLLPQRHTVAGASFQSPPVAMRGRVPLLAVGGANAVHLIPLKADGTFGGEGETLAVAKPSVTALAYSVKFDRLYIPVEKLP